MSAARVKVLVVEDSLVVRRLLVHLLDSDPEIQVIGTAATGREALEFLNHASPDVVLMDVEMPDMGGFEATRRIMEWKPLPIVICSGSGDPREASTTFRLMEAGAVAFVEKPPGTQHRDFESMVAHLLQTVKLMSEVKVVRRWPRPATPAPVARATRRAKSANVALIGIGASTGGPVVLQTILSMLPKDFAVPILVVQHIAAGFVRGLADWLNETTGVKVHVAAHGTEPVPGHVYLAPDDYHMTVDSPIRIVLQKGSTDRGPRPSVACLFESLARTCGSKAVGVLLSGMGKDGARELKQMKDRGAMTIVQDRESSVVHGMPGEAIQLGAAVRVLPAEQVADALVSHVNGQTPSEGGGR
ncbi:MAG TPA: chemotaxis-specific protein-glutamate methyltransferase CheB [Candidatus Limnocylindrales bacterium]|nr:chemotaxis-specific protein-glutamate methyltransferase CheB [Candidatus Limnocylindrales bacterium]